MISSEVERTLVKSPPELWAELSDPTALSRHLGELGEIRIVRTEPESTVEWTAENTTGTVSLKPSGWGTKVTLRVTREPDEPPTSAPGPPSAASAPELTPEPEAAQEPEAALEPGTPQDAQPDPDPEPEPEPEPTTVSDPAPPVARRGFFARLFGRRRAQAREPAGSVEQTAPADEPPGTTTEPLSTDRVPPTAAPETAMETDAEAGPTSEPGDAFAAIREALAPETFAAAHLFATQPGPGRHEPTEAPVQVPAPVAQPHAASTADAPQASQAPLESLTADASIPPQEPAVDIAAELLAAEEVASEQVTAVLTAVLDRLGAAHHRPFSRA
jgi:hypothetical protein